jgi:anti-sigma factor RsiW
MAKPSSLTAQDRDNLVAYLDGELDEGTRRALEAKLSRDPQARTELQALKRSYDLLDFLPRGEASSQFTSRTLERISTVQPAIIISSVDVEPRSSEVATPGFAKHWHILAGWSLAILFAALVGYFGTRAYWVRKRPPLPTDVDTALIQELRLFENKRLYDHVDDLNFLRSLDVSGFFNQEN